MVLHLRQLFLQVRRRADMCATLGFRIGIQNAEIVLAAGDGLVYILHVLIAETVELFKVHVSGIRVTWFVIGNKAVDFLTRVAFPIRRFRLYEYFIETAVVSKIWLAI